MHTIYSQFGSLWWNLNEEEIVHFSNALGQKCVSAADQYSCD